jgi:hypothetical protein
METVVLRALSRERDDRFSTAEAMREALFGAMAVGVSRPPVSRTLETLDEELPSDEPIPETKRATTTLLAASAIVLALIAATALWLGSAMPAQEGSPAEDLARPDRSPAATIERDPPMPEAPRPLPSPEPEPVRITLRGAPADALVTVDGEAVDGPSFEVSPGRGTVLVTVEAAGRRPWRCEVPTREAATLQVRMPRSEVPARPGKRKVGSSRPARAGAPPPLEAAPVASFGDVP